MYDLLHDFSKRPAPFSRYTAKQLWTAPHLAQQMLRYHLNQETDLASRRFDTIDRIVAWLDDQLKLSTQRLCDLGCGPGLYAQRFAQRGAQVTGVDFSDTALDYARRKADENQQKIHYLKADYLSDTLPTGFDLITLIYCDLCVLSPDQRSQLYKQMRTMLRPGGRIVIDVAGMGSFAQKHEETILEQRLMGGFWAAGDYVGMKRSYVYPTESLSLDRYLIIEPNTQWQIFNWFQHYTPKGLEAELKAAGFSVHAMVGALTGAPLTAESEYIGVIATVD